MERFGHHLGAISRSFWGHWDAVWEHFGQFGIMLRAMWSLFDSGRHFGRHLGILLETILHLGGHVWGFSCQKCRRFYGAGFYMVSGTSRG